MGATVNELTVVSLKIGPGARVSKGQKIAELESDKSVFEFEAPCDGLVTAIHAKAGDVRESGQPFVRIETSDVSLKHLAVSAGGAQRADPASAASSAKAEVSAAKAAAPAGAVRPLWTPKALKLAQQAGRDPAAITDIEATGPGNRVSGDDVMRYLAKSI